MAITAQALADYHQARGHQGPPAGCPTCAAKKLEQVHAARALRRRQRATTKRAAAL
jgi:hypothetical protein